MKKPLLKASFTLTKSTEQTLVATFARKAGGLLSHICPGASVKTPRGKKVTVSDIRTHNGLLLVKAVCWGVVEGMDMTLARSDFDVHNKEKAA